jgi:hypothetical protein
LLSEKDQELAGLREVLTQRARSLNKNIEALGGLREVLTQRAHLLMRRMKGLRVHAKLSPSARYGFESWRTLWSKFTRSDSTQL